MRRDHGTMRGALHQARQQGQSPDSAMHSALGQLDKSRQEWRDTFAAIAAAVGLAAALALIAQWQDAGYLPDGYEYDPSSDPDGYLADYLSTGAAQDGDGTVDRMRSQLYDAFKEAATAGTVLALIDALDGQYSTWTAGDVSGVGSGQQGGSTGLSGANTSTDTGTDASDLPDGLASQLASDTVVSSWSDGELDTAADVTSADNPDAPTDDNGDNLIAVKTWVCSNLPNSREWHVDADGQQVALDAQFEVAGELLDAPGDGSGMNSNNCCCSMSFDLVPATYALDSQTGDTSGDGGDYYAGE